MELLFESRLEIKDVTGKLYFFQHAPEVYPEPVLEGSSTVDRAGVSCFGSVLYDGGRYRMWHQAWPEDWDGRNSALVGYAESDDGITWRKPVLNMVDYHGRDNNLCNLGLCSPAVFIDPDAPPSHRYRATGCCGPSYLGAPAAITGHGYHTAHSADGLHWEIDRPAPTWHSADVITSVYHPGRRQGLVALKFHPRAGGFGRRSIWTATLQDGVWSRPRSALIPDDFDDVAALARGYASGDYYGMGMLPAGRGTVGFVWQFRHTLPRTAGSETGVFGPVDLSLVYQADENDCWVHMPGRPDFVAHGAVPWAKGGIYSAANVAEFGDEQRLYFSGSSQTHGWYVDANWKVIEKRRQQLIREGFDRVGYAHWPKGRLFGFHADPQGTLDLELGPVEEPCELVLNYEAEGTGCVQVELLTMEGWRETGEIEGRGRDDAVPLTGDSLGEVVRWGDGTLIQPVEGRSVTARLFVDCASLYAYEVRPVT